MYRHVSRAIALTVFCQWLPALWASADDWPRFRGANGAGVSTSRGLPVQLGPQTNVDWAVDVPFGRSSPVVVGDRVLITGTEGGKLVTMALDRSSGRRLWTGAVERQETATLYHGNDSATPTPASDGSNVYVLFHELGLLSYDASGRERWRHPLGRLRNFYGLSASPVLAGSRVLVVVDQSVGSFVIALDKDTGRELWRTARPGRRESYTTPVLNRPDAPRELVVYGSRHVDAYDLATGRLVWTLAGLSSAPVSSPLLAGDMLFVAGPDMGEEPTPPFSEEAPKHDKDRDGCLAAAEVAGTWIAEHFGYLDDDASGCITEPEWNVIAGELRTAADWGVVAIRLGGEAPKIAWNHRRNVPYIPSPLVYEDVLYIVKDGIVTSLDPRTGAVHKRDRLSREDKVKVYASPVAADGKVYFAGVEGKVAVVRAGAQWDVLAVNDLADEIYATPAVVEDGLYVRTKGKLYRFSSRGRSAVR